MSWVSQLLGMDAAENQGKASHAQQLTLQQMRLMMQQAQPYLQGVMQWMAQNAGLQLPGAPGIAGPQGVPQTQPVAQKPANVPGKQPFGPQLQAAAPRMPMAGTAPPTPTTMGGVSSGNGVPGLPNSALGIYGQNPADVFRMQQAEEDVNRLARQRAQMLQYRMGQQGMGNSATLGAGLARNEGDALAQLANFRRNLAMNAGQEQERRVAQLAQLLNLPISGGQQAAQGFGQLANQWGQTGANQQQQLMQLAMMFAGG